MSSQGARDRFYSSPPASHSLGMAYVWSPTAEQTGGANIVTGNWLPISATPDGAINVNAGLQFTGALNATINSVAVTGGSITVNNTAPIPISGVVFTVVTGAVSASFDTAPIVNSQGTGNARLLTDNLLLSGISGQLGGTLNVSVTNTAPMPISGVVQATVSIQNVAVTGGSIMTITTGSFSATVDNSAVITAIGSGNALLVIANQLNSGISGALAGNLSDTAYVTGAVSITNISQTNALLTGISGLLASNLTDPAYVTGAVSITNTAPLAVSGITQANITNTAPINISGWVTTIVTGGSVSASVSNPIGVTGVATDTALPVINGFATKFVPMGGRVVNASGAGSITGYNSTGDMAILNISAQNGGLLVNQGVLDYSQDTVSAVISGTAAVTTTGWNTGNIVTVTNRTSSVATNYGPSGVVPFTGGIAFFGQALAANSNRLEMFIQNIHTGTPLYVNLGATAASTGNFSMILNPSTVNNWGGSSFGSSRYKGAVQVSGGAWVAWEI